MAGVLFFCLSLSGDNRECVPYITQEQTANSSVHSGCVTFEEKRDNPQGHELAIKLEGTYVYFTCPIPEIGGGWPRTRDKENVDDDDDDRT